MEVVTLIFFGVILVYALFIGVLAYGLKKIPLFEPSDLEPQTKFSIVIPFRNEAENLPNLLYSLSQLQYPTDHFEILFIDDSSEDNSIEIIKKFSALTFNFKIVENVRASNSPKKDAIVTAIHQIQNEWILTTDADCFVNQNWLKVLDNYIQIHNPEMISGAVSFLSGESFLAQFQQMDMMSLQGATIGSFGIEKPFMCNGANFAYTKKLFKTVNGFDGNDKMGSGDDVFLLQKAVGNKNIGIEKIHYLKSDEFLVLTNPLDSWKSVFNQRIRWASKASSYESSFGKIAALIVFAGNLAIVLSFILMLFSFFSFWNWYLLFAIKIGIDFLILFQTGKFLKPKSVKFFLLINLFYPFFSTSVALCSLFGKYEWKGRTFQD